MKTVTAYKEGAQKYIGIRRGILTEYESRIQYVKGVLEIAEGIWLIPHRKSDYSKIALRNDLYDYSAKSLTSTQACLRWRDRVLARPYMSA